MRLLTHDAVPPGLERSYAVFSQRADALVDIAGWNAHATRFFATRLGLTEDRRRSPDEPPPRTDEVTFVVAPDGAAPGLRAAFARPAEPTDLALADLADHPSGGLALLARRCPTLWLVPREADGDALALRLAAILSSVLLGPILDASAREIFGVKTARAKLSALASPPAP